MTHLRRGLLPVVSFLAIAAVSPTALAERPDVERPDRGYANQAPDPDPGAAPIPDRVGWLEMVLVLGTDMGRDVTLSLDAGAFLSVRLAYGLHLGPSMTAMLGGVDGMEGCSTAKYCEPSRWRAGGRAEYHFITEGLYRPWAALELGREQWQATQPYVGGGPRSSFARTVWGAHGGVDFVTRSGSALAGVGVYGGVNVDNAAFGLVFGVRMVMGGF